VGHALSPVKGNDKTAVATYRSVHSHPRKDVRGASSRMGRKKNVEPSKSKKKNRSGRTTREEKKNGRRRKERGYFHDWPRTKEGETGQCLRITRIRLRGQRGRRGGEVMAQQELFHGKKKSLERQPISAISPGWGKSGSWEES